MENSHIGWTDHTWNPWWGCSKVSAGCKHCYISGIMKYSGNKPFGGPIKTKTKWNDPSKWNREAQEARRRYRIFTCSMSDFFHPGADEWRTDAWKIIKDCEHLDWLILTKRPNLIRERLPKDWGAGYPNVWLGVTVVEQEYVERINTLASIPAAIRFVSAEPLLGPLRFKRRLQKIDWVITGCENAGKNKRREMDPKWVQSIHDQCDATNTALFHKQYYLGTKLTYDGLIDGVVRQSWPQSVA